MKISAIIILVLFLSPLEGWSQTRKPSSITELAAYMGADREQLLYAGAKSEGKVVWYTSLAGGSYKALATAFEAKYPGVTVETFRAYGKRVNPQVGRIERKRGEHCRCDRNDGRQSMFMRDGKLSVLITRYISKNIPMMPRSQRRKGFITGLSPENLISVLCTTKTSYPKGSPRKALMSS